MALLDPREEKLLKFKAMAKALREKYRAKDVYFSHSKCLEILSRAAGFKDWNAACALIDRVDFEKLNVIPFDWSENEKKNDND